MYICVYVYLYVFLHIYGLYVYIQLDDVKRKCFFQDPCALALLGECQADLGDFEGAVKSLEDAVRLDPQNRSAQKDLLRLRQQVGRV